MFSFNFDFFYLGFSTYTEVSDIVMIKVSKSKTLKNIYLKMLILFQN